MRTAATTAPGTSVLQRGARDARRSLLLLSRARLPTGGVVILRAAATPLNRCRALRARPGFVQTVFLERGTRLTPLRVQTDHVGHDNHATLRPSRVSRVLLEPARSGGSPHTSIHAGRPGPIG